MHYFEENIGDTIKRTAHLSFAERGAFGLMKSYACLTEAPFPVDPELLFRKLMARSSQDKRIVRQLLEEFWQLSDKGWEHPKWVQELISDYHAFLESQSDKSAKGVEARRKKKKPPAGDPAVTHGLSTGDPDTTRSGNHFPLPTSQEPLPTTQGTSAGGAPEVEFGPNFPDSADKAIAWLRGSMVAGEAPDEWIREVWLQAAGRGGKDAAGAVIERFPFWAASRWSKEGGGWLEERKNREKKEGAAAGMIFGVEPPTFPWEMLTLMERGYTPAVPWEKQTGRFRRDLRELWAGLPAERREEIEKRAAREKEGAAA